MPRSLSAPLAFVIPIVEVSLSGCFLLGLSRVRLGWSLIALLGIFQLAYAIEWLRGREPTCACLGVLVRSWMFASLAKYVLLRNTVLMFMPLVSIKRVPCVRHARRESMDKASASVRGFSLLETLVVCAMVAILIGMCLPILQRARFSSRESRNLANLRTHTQLFLAYSAAHRDSMPSFMDTKHPLSTFTTSSGLIATFPYFFAATYWNIALADELYDGRWNSPVFTTPYAAGDAPTWSQYQWSCDFITDPKYHSPSHRPPPAQLRSVRIDEVLYPSVKVMFSAQRPFATRFAVSGASPLDAAHVSLSDGRAISVMAKDTTPLSQGGDGHYPEWGSMTAEHHGGLYVGTHTPNGVRGRDLR